MVGRGRVIFVGLGEVLLRQGQNCNLFWDWGFARQRLEKAHSQWGNHMGGICGVGASGELDVSVRQEESAEVSGDILETRDKGPSLRTVLDIATHKQLLLKPRGPSRAVFYYYYYLFYIFAALGLHCFSWAFSSCGKWGPLSSCGERASHCGDVSRYRARVLERGLGSFGTWASLPHSMWNLPGPGIESMFPALAGRFPTSGPLGKSLPHSLTHNGITLSVK